MGGDAFEPNSDPKGLFASILLLEEEDDKDKEEEEEEGEGEGEGEDNRYDIVFPYTSSHTRSAWAAFMSDKRLFRLTRSSN